MNPEYDGIAEAYRDSKKLSFRINYARTKEELLNFVQVAYNRLRLGGRFIGFNDNVQQVPRGIISLRPIRIGFSASKQ